MIFYGCFVCTAIAAVGIESNCIFGGFEKHFQRYIGIAHDKGILIDTAERFILSIVKSFECIPLCRNRPKRNFLPFRIIFRNGYVSAVRIIILYRNIKLFRKLRVQRFRKIGIHPLFKHFAVGIGYAVSVRIEPAGKRIAAQPRNFKRHFLIVNDIGFGGAYVSFAGVERNAAHKFRIKCFVSVAARRDFRNGGIAIIFFFTPALENIPLFRGYGKIERIGDAIRFVFERFATIGMINNCIYGNFPTRIIFRVCAFVRNRCFGNSIESFRTEPAVVHVAGIFIIRNRERLALIYAFHPFVALFYDKRNFAPPFPYRINRKIAGNVIAVGRSFVRNVFRHTRRPAYEFHFSRFVIRNRGDIGNSFPVFFHNRFAVAGAVVPIKGDFVFGNLHLGNKRIFVKPDRSRFGVHAHIVVFHHRAVRNQQIASFPADKRIAVFHFGLRKLRNGVTVFHFDVLFVQRSVFCRNESFNISNLIPPGV